jgi:hypothetical protein
MKLQTLWAERETASFALSPRALAHEPGDLIRLGDDPRPYRIERVTEGAVRRVEARAVEPAISSARPVDGRHPPNRPPPGAAGPPMAVVLNLPATGDSPEPLQHLAVAADPWPERVAVYRAPAEGAFVLHRLVDAPAVIGRTLSTFGPGPVWRWDRRSALEVELSGGSIASLDDAAALAGGNLLAVLGPDGAAEIVSARDAELIGERRYRLSTFLRGLGGTEHLATRALATGMTIVLLDGAVLPLATSLAEIGQDWAYRIGPAGRDPSDPTYIELPATTTANALLPLAPVQARARRTAGGIELTWIRRTRLDGDGWNLVDVPLGEEIEAYAIDILAGPSVVRTIAAGTSAALYGVAAELADFGTPQSFLALRIHQLSRSVGRGRPAEVILPVH